MLEEKWFQKSCFRNLVDMHINNGDDRLLASFDAEAYAENMKTAGFDTAYLYGSNCLGFCLFPTRTGYRHQIAEKRDIFGETVSACRRKGIRTVGYLNHWSTEGYNRHPEWRVISRDGSGSRDVPGNDGRFGVCCMNSSYRDYFLALVKELCENYPIEGLWVDMVGFWRTACYCGSCRKRFREETGLEIPVRIDWESPQWRRYVKFKEDSMNRYARDITETAKEARPGISVSIQCAGWTLGHHVGFSTEFFALGDYSAGDFYTDVREQAVDCKFLRGVTPNQPFEYMVPRCPDLACHTVSKPIWQLRQQAYAAFLHGGAFLCIDAIDPEGTMNPAVYRTFGEVKKSLKPYWKHPSFLRGDYINDAAVYLNFRSMINLGENGQEIGKGRDISIPLIGRLKAINRKLAESHIQYDIITDLNLRDLARYPVIILSEIAVLSEKETEAFREYVRNGGNLYISGRSGVLKDLDAEAWEPGSTLKREDFALKDVMGVSKSGIIPFHTIYIKGKKESSLFTADDLKYPLCTAGPGLKVTAHEDTQVLAEARMPVSNNSDGNYFISAISDPPWQDTEIPVLTEHPFGKGICIYSALLPEAEDTDMAKALWIGIIERLLKGRRTIRIEAPVCVEVSVKRETAVEKVAAAEKETAVKKAPDVKKSEDTVYISLLHTLANETLSPAGPVRIRVSDQLLKVNTADAFPAGGITLVREGNETIVTAEGLPEFAVITLK